MRPRRMLLLAASALALGGEVGAEEKNDHGRLAAEPPARSISCVIAEPGSVRADTLVYDEATNGNAIAKLSGATIPLTLSSFPSSMKGRVRLATSLGTGTVRIEGYAESHRFRFFAERDLPLVGSHLWLTAGMELDLVSAAPSGFRLRHAILGSNGQSLEAAIPCDGVTLAMVPPSPSEPPKSARNYQMKHPTLALYDRPSGEVVFVLKMAEETRKIFWSQEARGGFVHLVSRADVTIDAWAKASDLVVLRHAELFDLDGIAPKPHEVPELTLQDPPAIITATSEMPIHRLPENSPTAIGTVEIGARFHPLEQSGAFTNIMPEGLAVRPSGGGGFWVRTAGLPRK